MRYCVAIVVLATLAAFVWAADTPAFRDPGYVARYLDQHSEAFVSWLPTILTAEQLQQVEAWVYGQVTDADRAAALEAMKARLDALQLDAVADVAETEIARLRAASEKPIQELEK